LRFALSEILSQLIEKTDRWHFVIFHFRKFTDSKRNYTTNEDEMLVIISCCKKWRQYIEDAQHTIWMFIDHCKCVQVKFIKHKSYELL
jgi:hypothetical protein